MQILEIVDEKYKERWNKLAPHPLQAWEWGEFRAKTGIKVVRYGIFDPSAGSGQAGLVEPIQVTIHPIPHTPWTVGYYPKGNELTNEHTNVLKKIAQQYNCIFIKCEPKVEKQDSSSKILDSSGSQWAQGRSLFTQYNFVLDVTPSEEELLKNMKQKTRYNIRVAEKKAVTVEVDNSPAAFDRYLELTQETTARQGFYAHGPRYHSLMWETLHRRTGDTAKQLTAHLLTARYDGQIITTWVLFRLGDTLYYPYGASTRDHRDVMANNLVMWEAIKLAKKWTLTTFDMWGALGPDPDPHDPWYGFHTFKSGYGARHVEYIGTWDYVAKPMLYSLYRVAENIRWWILRKLK